MNKIFCSKCGEEHTLHGEGSKWKCSKCGKPNWRIDPRVQSYTALQAIAGLQKAQRDASLRSQASMTRVKKCFCCDHNSTDPEDRCEMGKCRFQLAEESARMQAQSANTNISATKQQSRVTREMENRYNPKTQCEGCGKECRELDLDDGHCKECWGSPDPEPTSWQLAFLGINAMCLLSSLVFYWIGDAWYKCIPSIALSSLSIWALIAHTPISDMLTSSSSSK